MFVYTHWESESEIVSPHLTNRFSFASKNIAASDSVFRKIMKLINYVVTGFWHIFHRILKLIEWYVHIDASSFCCFSLNSETLFFSSPFVSIGKSTWKKRNNAIQYTCVIDKAFCWLLRISRINYILFFIWKKEDRTSISELRLWINLIKLLLSSQFQSPPRLNRSCSFWIVWCSKFAFTLLNFWGLETKTTIKKRYIEAKKTLDSCLWRLNLLSFWFRPHETRRLPALSKFSINIYITLFCSVSLVAKTNKSSPWYEVKKREPIWNVKEQQQQQ